MLENTIRAQEEEETKRGQEADKALLEAKEKLAAGNKRAAVRHMKKVKRCHIEQEKITCAIEKMEAQIYTIESAMNNLKVLEAMQAGSSTLGTLQLGHGKGKSTQANVADQVDALMEEIRDSNEIAVEVNEILSRDVSALQPMDEDELLRELEALDENHDRASEALCQAVAPSSPPSSSVRFAKPEPPELLQA